MLWPFLYFYAIRNRRVRENLIGPSLLATDNTKLTSSTNTTRLTIDNGLAQCHSKMGNKTALIIGNRFIHYLPLTHSYLSNRYEEEQQLWVNTRGNRVLNPLMIPLSRYEIESLKEAHPTSPLSHLETSNIVKSATLCTTTRGIVLENMSTMKN